MISTDNLEICTDKIDPIKRWQPRKNVRNIQCFLGLINIYRRFIQDCSKIAKPIQQLIHKDSKFQYTAECQCLFEQLKSAFVSYPVYRYFYATKQIIVETDALDYLVAAIISNDLENSLHPITFYSRIISPAECNYAIEDKEIAIKGAFSVWQYFLDSANHQIEVIIDHKTLQKFTTTKSLTRAQLC